MTHVNRLRMYIVDKRTSRSTRSESEVAIRDVMRCSKNLLVVDQTNRPFVLWHRTSASGLDKLDRSQLSGFLIGMESGMKTYCLGQKSDHNRTYTWLRSWANVTFGVEALMPEIRHYWWAGWRREREVGWIRSLTAGRRWEHLYWSIAQMTIHALAPWQCGQILARTRRTPIPARIVRIRSPMSMLRFFPSSNLRFAVHMYHRTVFGKLSQHWWLLWRIDLELFVAD